MSNEESSVRVAVRIRPQTPGEVVEGCGVCARAGGAAGEGGISLGAERAFTFDFTFEPSASQHELYQTCVRKLVEAALDGYNATVLAYGQTGSGKTYTMGSGWEGDGAGDEELRGIIPRAIRDLFSGADQRAEDARTQGLLPPEFSVQAQFIELYNEDIVDLLDPAKDPFAKGGLRITEDGCGGVRIVGASMRPVRSATEALAALRAGALARTTAATNMNSSSSRSHAVFTLMMRQRRLAADQEQEGEKDADTPEQYETLTAKFHFVDLAGSERLKRTGATGERAREGISINCGLLALGNVISALGDKSRKVLHVPYRDSKLTRLLQDSLGGNSNTVMIACVSPSDRDFMETLNTLKYANRARNIKNRCVVNQDLTSRTINQLRQEVARLQLELAEYKQGKRVINESGEEGWSDVVQENAILTGEVEALRRRVKAMQGTIDQLSARNSELVAEKALATWAPSDTSPEANDCSLTTLVQGYVSEIEDLRAQLMEANALYSASRQRTTRTRHESVMDTSTVIDDAKRELYKEKELLARSMGELEFQRKLNMSGDGRGPIGERERAEGESAEESDLEEEEESDEEAEEDAKQQHALSAQLAALSDDMDTKERLIEQLEISQRRLESLRQHYEQRLDTLHHQIRAASDEKDKVLASLASQSSPPSDKLKRVKSEYETRISGMSRELRRLQAAARDHQRLQRAQRAAADQLAAARHDLAAMKRDKVKLIHRMREEAKRHAQTLAARAKEVAQLKKESRKNANLIRSLEAETKLKEQVLKRKQEEVSLLRRGHRDKLSNKAAGRIPERRRSRQSCQQLWARLELYVERAVAARSTLAELEATLDAQLRERDRATEPTAQTRLRAAIADTQAQIMQIEEETDDTELSRILDEMRSVEAGRFAAQQLCARALLLAHHAAAARAAAAAAAARLHQAEEKAERLAMSMRAASPGLAEPPLWGVPAGALAALLAKVSSGTSTRSVSPDSSMFESRPRVQCNTAPASPPDDNSNNTSPFLRNTGRRGSVRLRDLGVVGREEADGDVMTQSLVDAAPRPAPLCRVPSAPASLKAPLTPTSGPVWSPLVARRVPPESPRVTRRSTNNTSNPPLINTTNKPPSLEASISCGTPPASPGAARRLREEDVFLRLTGATSDNSPQGVVKEVASKRVMGGGAWLQCTHVCEGHAGAVLSLLATSRHLYSGGVDRTVRAWDVAGRGEAWRGSCGGGCGGGVTALAGGGGGGALLAAAGGGVRVFDPRAAAPAHTLWSSGGTAVSPRGEQAVTGLALAAQHRLYMAVGDKLRLWDLRMMECVCKLWSGHAAAVMCLAVGAAAGGADFVATGSKDHYVRTLYMNDTNNGTWEGSSRRLLEPPHYDGVQALALCGDVLYSGSRDSSLKTWTRDGSLTHSVMNAHKGWVTSVCPLWSGGGEQVVATAGRDAALRVWGGGGGGPGGGGGGGPGGGGGLRPLAGPLPLPDAPHALAAINHTIYTAGNGGEVRVWRLSMEHSQ